MVNQIQSIQRCIQNIKTLELQQIQFQPQRQKQWQQHSKSYSNKTTVIAIKQSYNNTAVTETTITKLEQSQQRSYGNNNNSSYSTKNNSSYRNYFSKSYSFGYSNNNKNNNPEGGLMNDAKTEYVFGAVTSTVVVVQEFKISNLGWYCQVNSLVALFKDSIIIVIKIIIVAT
ncbi:hypothetical protein ACTA71_010339 [Dictyostelium dimigraforme]